jgi:hypothetical protein
LANVHHIIGKLAPIKVSIGINQSVAAASMAISFTPAALNPGQ